MTEESGGHMSSRTRMARPRAKNVSLALRSLAVLLVLLSPWAPEREVATTRQTVAFVVDESLSVDAALATAEQYLREALSEAESRDIETLVVRFGTHAAIDADPLAEPRVESLLDEPPPTPAKPGAEPHARPEESLARLATSVRQGTDIEAALLLAAASLPAEGSRRVVLLSDGRHTTGDVAAALEDLAALEIPVDIVDLDGERGAGDKRDDTIGPVELARDRVPAGGSVVARVTVRGEPGATMSVFFRRRVEGADESTELGAVVTRLDDEGNATVQYTDREPPGGLVSYSAELHERYRRRTWVRGGYQYAPPLAVAPRALAIVGEGARALIVTLLGEEPTLLVDALRQADFTVDNMQLTEGQLDADRLAGIDLVVLADLPLERSGEVSVLSGLNVASQELLVRWVREEGGGLIVTGGAFGFGPDYADSPLALALPVSIQDQGDVEDPEVALAVMLDRSGSMGARVGEHTKMSLAVEAALASAATLRDRDRVGIAAIDTRTVWHQPIAPRHEVATHREAIRAISAGGGGIYVYTALADAYRELAGAPEPIRHVILFSDTRDSEEQHQGCPFRPCRRRLPWAVDLARDARATGITTSVVGIGEAGDTDTRFLQQLAAGGGGRFYLTSSGRDLRRIFVTETRATARSNLREEATSVRRVGDHPVVRGLAAFPAIDGHVETLPRATAELGLETVDERPLLASWRYGLGNVLAFTSDAGGRWSAAWSEWAGAGQLFRQMARFAQRESVPARADTRARVEAERYELAIDVPPEAGEDAIPTTVSLVAVDAEGSRHAFEGAIARVGLGRYRVRATLPEGVEGVLARVRDERGRLVAEDLCRASHHGELAARGVATETLDAWVSGQPPELGARRNPSPVDAVSDGSVEIAGRESVAPWLLALALVLLVLDLFIRRRARPRAKDPRIAAILAQLPLPSEGRAEEEELDDAA